MLPVPFAYVPGSQFVHLVPIEFATVPSAQGSQLACPKAVATCPALHLVHEDCPVEACAVPRGHFVHSLAAEAENDPEGHVRQLASPLVVYVPELQASHLSAPTPE